MMVLRRAGARFATTNHHNMPTNRCSFRAPTRANFRWHLLKREQQISNRVSNQTIDFFRQLRSNCANRLQLGDANTCLNSDRVQAMVEFTSPTTTTQSGFSARQIGSNRFMTSAVWTAWEPEPTSRLKRGAGMPSSSKNT